MVRRIPNWRRETSRTHARLHAGAGCSHRGFTLLEVLIAMFIIMFGLLGIAALLPIASQDMSRAARADRAAACGRSALAEMRVRQFCDPVGWISAYAQPSPPNPPKPGIPANEPYFLDAWRDWINAAESYAIDPLYIAWNTGAPGIDQFPYNPVAPNAQLQWDSGLQWSMPRVSLAHAGILARDVPKQLAVFDRIFTWQDDVVFGRPADQTRRATPVFTGPPASPEYLSFEGRFSWLATVSLEPGQNVETPMLPVSRKLAFRVSVVVWDRRAFEAPGPSGDPNEPPAERWADVVAFPGGGVGGGDVRLQANDPSWLALRQGEWLMLAGLEPVPSPPALQPYYRKVYRWYRILALGDIESNPPTPPQRVVTLAGPDWNVNGQANWNVKGRAKAALFTGVVGVYTETIEVER